MNQLYSNISIAQLKKMFNIASIKSIGDDFFIGDLRYEKKTKLPFFNNIPTRIDGYVGLFCVSGNLTLTSDLKEFKITRNTFSVITPGNIIRMVDNTPQIGCHLIAVVISSKYMAKLRFDMNRFFNQTISPVAHPTIHLNWTEVLLAMKYYSLMKNVISSNRPYVAESIMALCASLVYEVAGSWGDRIKELTGDRNDTQNRNHVIYDNFIKLVARYHVKERSVQFYADKLCISTKYLAKVVKLASGQTPSYWIDSYVILEAENLLRYTSDTIKQIVYKLNFTNQSVFQKFFKAHTGMTPLEYRKK